MTKNKSGVRLQGTFNGMNFGWGASKMIKLCLKVFLTYQGRALKNRFKNTLKNHFK